MNPYQHLLDTSMVKTHKKFTAIEDQRLRELVAQFGARKWKSIALLMPGRTGRQCRDRYTNYLCPGFFNGEWTAQEDQLLADKYKEYGPSWAKMVTFFEGRTANSLKNRWNYCVCRMQATEEEKQSPPEPLSPKAEPVSNEPIVSAAPDIGFLSIDYLMSRQKDIIKKEP